MNFSVCLLFPNEYCYCSAGFMADTFGSYNAAFFMSGSLCVFAAVIISLASFIKTSDKTDDISLDKVDMLVVIDRISVV